MQALPLLPLPNLPRALPTHCSLTLSCVRRTRYSRDQAQAELEDVAEQLRKEEEMRVGLDEQVLQLQRDLESAKGDLTTTRATAAAAAAAGGAAAAAAAGAGAARSAGGAAASGVDSARLVELEGLLSARTNELQETNARCAACFASVWLLTVSCMFCPWGAVAVPGMGYHTCDCQDC